MRKPKSEKKIRDVSVAQQIRHVVGSEFVKKRWCVQFEVGLPPHGSMRADLIATNMGSFITIVEVKSSVADFRSDKKWQKYLLSCDQFFFAFNEKTYAKVKDEIPKGVGIMVVANGRRKIKQKAAIRDVKPETRLQVMARMAYRGAAMNKHTHKNKIDLGSLVAGDVESHINAVYPKMPARATVSIKAQIQQSLATYK